MKVNQTTTKLNNSHVIASLVEAKQSRKRNGEEIASSQTPRNDVVSFTNAGIAGAAILRALEVSPAWGAVATDIASMTGPRTIIDFIERGPNMGLETGRQQGSSTLNHAFIGFYGAGAGLLLSGAFGLNKVKGHKVFASTDVLNKFKKAFEDTKDADETFKKVLGDTEAILADGTKKKLSEIEGLVGDAFTAYQDKKPQLYAKHLIMKATGSESNYKLTEKSVLSLNEFVDNLFSITDTLKSSKVQNDAGKFFKSMKNFGLARSALGLGIASAIGLSMQPLNMYLTRRKTGSDGFTGVKGRKKDKSAGFTMFKTILGAAGLIGVLASISRKPAELLTKLQFKGMVPTLSQFKLVYGLTIASRFLSARDKDELREATVRDTIGFLSWLVFGGFVTRGVVKVMDKSLMKESWDGKGFFKSTLVTRDEIVHNALNQIPGVDTFKNGKEIPFKELMKELNKHVQTSEIARTAKKQLSITSIGQLSGYAFSCIVLGILLQKLNIHMTKKSEERRQAKLAAEHQVPNETNTTIVGLLKPQISDIIKK